jgi:hypothetical protein
MRLRPARIQTSLRIMQNKPLNKSFGTDLVFYRFYIDFYRRMPINFDLKKQLFISKYF